MLMCLIGPPGGFASPKPVLAQVSRSFLPCWETTDSFIFTGTAEQHVAGLHTSPPRRAISGPDPAPRSRERCHRLGLIKSIVSPEFCTAEPACRGLMCPPALLKPLESSRRRRGSHILRDVPTGWAPQASRFPHRCNQSFAPCRVAMPWAMPGEAGPFQPSGKRGICCFLSGSEHNPRVRGDTAGASLPWSPRGFPAKS